MSDKKSLQHLVDIMAKLRSPEGCPWDKEQDYASIRPCVIEEAYEVVQAIDDISGDMSGDNSNDKSGDMSHNNTPLLQENLKEELGDLLFQIVFLSQLASEDKIFDIYDVIETVGEKMVRRHPHVFGDESIDTSKEVLKRWGEIKETEKSSSAVDDNSNRYLKNIPAAMPQLLRAKKITKKAAKVGFDWQTTEQVLQKVDEEVGEFKDALKKGDTKEMEAEFGDILFALANLGRFIEVDPEEALRKTIIRFTNRFNFIEDKLKENGSNLKQASFDEMEALWTEAKKHYKD